MTLAGKNIVVLDLETLQSADDCRHCGQAESAHYAHGACAPWEGQRPADHLTQFSALGWNDKPALGLSIGCWFAYQDGQLHWFDVYTLEATMRAFVDGQPLLVSFNGIGFDFPLMRGLVRREADTLRQRNYGLGLDVEVAEMMTALCDDFKTLCATSYDILAEIWKQAPVDKYKRGLNSLDALCQANDLPAKEMDGSTAPRLWQQGRCAEVIQYNVGDVLRTKALFELILTQGNILRGDGLPIYLPLPAQLADDIPCEEQ
jgi:hypothetical protein